MEELISFNPDVKDKVLVDDLTEYEKTVIAPCLLPDLNTVGTVYDLEFHGASDNPIDLQRSMIRISGCITGLTAHGYEALGDFQTSNVGLAVEGETRPANRSLADESLNTRHEFFPSGWIYSAFTRATMSIGGTDIEIVNDLAATMEMKKCLYREFESLCRGVYMDECLWDIPEDVTIENKKCGENSNYAFTHCVNRFGEYEFEIPLSTLFETVKTMPFIPKHMRPVIRLERNKIECVGMSSSAKTGAVATTTPVTLPDGAADTCVDVRPATTSTLRNEIETLSLVYVEYKINDPIKNRAIEEMYQKPITFKHRKWQCHSLTYTEPKYQLRLPLNPSRHGNNALVLAWVENSNQETRSQSGAGYIQMQTDLNNLKVSYGPLAVCDYPRLNEEIDKENIRQDEKHVNMVYSATAEKPAGKVTGNGIVYQSDVYMKELYKQYLRNCSTFYQDPSLAMPYLTFVKRHPYVVIDLKKQQLTNGLVNAANMINVVVDHNGANMKFNNETVAAKDTGRRLMCWLLTNEIMIFDPKNGTVITGGA